MSFGELVCWILCMSPEAVLFSSIMSGSLLELQVHARSAEERALWEHERRAIEVDRDAAREAAGAWSADIARLQRDRELFLADKEAAAQRSRSCERNPCQRSSYQRCSNGGMPNSREGF